MEDFKWETGTNVLLGIWLVLSPFFFNYETGIQLASHALAGAAIAILAAARTWGEHTGVWADALIALLGAWVIVSPWALGFADNPALTFNDVMVGAIVLAFALASSLVLRREPTFTGAAPSDRRDRED